MEKILGKYTHNTLGTLRTIKADGENLFCAADVAAMLGFSDPKSTIAYHFPGAEKHEHYALGKQVRMCPMKFIPLEAVEYLMERSTGDMVGVFRTWFYGDVLYAMGCGAVTETDDPYDPEREYLIHFGDYMKHINDKLFLLLMLREMIADVKKLPDCQHTREIRAFAENCGKETDAMWEGWGIPERYLDSDDPEDLLDLLEMELIPPELVGYRYEPEYIPNELEDEPEDDSGNDDAAYNLLDIMERIIGEAADRVNMVHEALKKGKETLCAG
ncbi:MAG: hypothetical protein IJF78_10280 [Clostridia bacterium]|nr:hypothetical protein [Clostridia bacterium]